jgi:hypothetical protein
MRGSYRYDPIKEKMENVCPAVTFGLSGQGHGFLAYVETKEEATLVQMFFADQILDWRLVDQVPELALGSRTQRAAPDTAWPTCRDEAIRRRMEKV